VTGYREVLRHLHAAPGAIEGNQVYRDALEKLRTKTLLPVVECRMTNVLVDKSGSGQRINFHLIFDPEVPADDIETFLKGQMVGGKSIGQRYLDKKFLLEEVQVSFDATCNALSSNGTFKDRFLAWLPYDEYGGIGDIDPMNDKLFKEHLTRCADIMGSANKKQSDFFLWRNKAFTETQYREWFGSRKPCIKGSDSHDVNDEIGRLKDAKSQPADKYCWIKADPTFKGLCQIVHEPEDRVFIGTIPPKLHSVKSEPTRFIDTLRIYRSGAPDSSEQWFDCDLPLSADMVAIIGNKGSGKSALADILGLAGNTLCDPGHFSFLIKPRFNERNGRLSKNFEAAATWWDGTTATVPLNGKANLNGVELVRYIPQKYLETVCTEMEPGEGSEFQQELRKVIFSHISDADRLGKGSLDELIRFKTEALNEKIGNERREISKLNDELIRLEQRGSIAHVAQLEAAAMLKQQELKIHNEAKPVPVEQPENITAEQQAVTQQITLDLDAERSVLTAIDTEMVLQQGHLMSLTEQVASGRKLVERLANLESELTRFKRETEVDMLKVGVSFADLVTAAVDKGLLERRIEALSVQRAAVDLTLAAGNPDGLPMKRASSLDRIKTHQNKLDAPNKIFQQYNESLRAWSDKLAAIEGTVDKPDTRKWYEGQLRDIALELPAQIAHIRGQRYKVVKAIHAGIVAVRDIYTEMFAAVQQLISGSSIIKDRFKLTFESRIVDRSFQKEFLDQYLSQGSAGSFYSKEKGAIVLEELRAEFDFASVDQCIMFIEKVEEFLKVDMRSVQRTKMNIAQQLRKGIDVKALYDFLWSLSYLAPEYSLKLDGKDLGHLSPGERGTLLLVFYLLVDKSNTPIIVDQPEENLDSQTVFNLLRPVIKDVKQRRQIIMVTHSPNIAVVCDAEQIIHANIDRAAGNKVIYTTGAIEAPEINRFLVNVLEGTRPAFDNREAKYQPQ